LAPKPDQSELFADAPPSSLSDEERLACLRLIRSENVGPVTFRDLINYYGGAAKALEILPTLSRRSGSGRPLQICPKADAERELKTAQRIGAVPFFTLEPGYPPLLAAIDAPPPLVYVKGDPNLFTRPAVAIVGSRQCSAAGVQLTKLLATQLAEAGFIIVSGLARGIERAAHEASLKSGTVAVVAGGIDWVYPPEHADLQARIGTEGCLITERPPGLQPRDKDFPRRNRIIAGLSLGVVVVEAALRSGSLITARLAQEAGRELFAVPGSPLDPRSRGANDLIRQGAHVTETAADVLENLPDHPHREGLSRDPLFARGPTPGITEPTPTWEEPVEAPTDLLKTRMQVLDLLSTSPTAVDEVVRHCQFSAAAVMAVLLELELAGRIQTLPGSRVALLLGAGS
jgi:DNA processing protein